MKKITLATVKSFIKKAHSSKGLYVKIKSSFNGMTDGVDQVEDKFEKAEREINLDNKHTLGLRKVWFVGQGRNVFDVYQDEEYIGYSVWNCCGEFIVAIKNA